MSSFFFMDFWIFFCFSDSPRLRPPWLRPTSISSNGCFSCFFSYFCIFEPYVYIGAALSGCNLCLLFYFRVPEKKEIDVLSPERYEEVHEGLQYCQLNVFQPFWESVKKIPFPYLFLSMKTEKGNTKFTHQTYTTNHITSSHYVRK